MKKRLIIIAHTWEDVEMTISTFTTDEEAIPYMVKMFHKRYTYEEEEGKSFDSILLDYRLWLEASADHVQYDTEYTFETEIVNL